MISLLPRDRLEKLPFVFAFRRGDFALRHKVFCAKAQGVLRRRKSVLPTTFLLLSLDLAPTKPRPLTPEARLRWAVTGVLSMQMVHPSGCKRLTSTPFRASMPSLLVGRSKRLNGVSVIETGGQVHQATERRRVQRLMFVIVIRVGSSSYFSYGGSFKLSAKNLSTHCALVKG